MSCFPFLALVDVEHCIFAILLIVAEYNVRERMSVVAKEYVIGHISLSLMGGLWVAIRGDALVHND